MVLELADIQGNILRGYSFPRAIHLFVAFPDADAGRRLLRALVPQVQTAARWDERPETALNVALTYAGLRLLGADDECLPGALREPIAQRAPTRLGDDLRTWRGELGRGKAHALVLLAGDGWAFAQRLRTLRTLLDEHGVEVGFEQRTEALADQREHFGFADGFGQPAVEGTDHRRAGQGEPEEYGSWRDIKAGEFVHGYEDEDAQTETAPLLRNGSFMVYRKLEQDVERFRSYLDREADHYCATVGVNHGTDPDTAHAYARELVAAKLIGRWRDGVAVELAPERDPAEAHALRHESVGEPDNDFRYADDRDGRRCPVGAHVRRANPRDSARATAQTRRHRIIRRGMPYEEGDARGLVFICFNASFERQFETVQRLWCDDGNAFGLGRDQDVLFASGAGSGKLTIPGEPPHFARAERGLVTTRGCEYLLMPGLRALRALAEGGER
ncbi:Dyp-type peroxidase [Solirubrobacter phytolaccae]|uniref:Dyp-type peroxidase n=1 Tax=Solirubrobacter phytolaccae TaxID=1404360 RepID=A0A9X3NBT7_9ACTN|nr:Dyp-type peroxidase domain-containing protein [Solirubrobacter phytolaccae]MDA0182199.1 Dyp-type peroxidase [Solirubrobacter phytolaccae]